MSSLPPPGLDPRRYFTVGPTQLHPVVPSALREALEVGLPSWSHRSADFRKVVSRTEDGLRALLGVPEGHRILFLSSATEAMERLLQGGVSRRSHHLVNGAFARRFHRIAAALGVQASHDDVPDGRGFDLDGVRVPDGVELLALTQNETSTGVALDPAGMARLAERHPDLLLAVDTVTAAPILPLDLERVDAAFFSVQKLFGLPPGLGVLIASPRLVERARERMSRGEPVGAFFHLPALADAADRGETAATPNSLTIHLLGRVAEALLRRGVVEVRREHAASATRLQEAARRRGWTPFPPIPAERSTTILVFDVPEGSEAARARLAQKGFLVGSGYGAGKETRVRIGNFPSHSPEAVEALARALEDG